jgi:hypothetical protein
MLAQRRTRPFPTDTEYPTLLEELQAMAAAGLVSLQIDSEGEMRVAVIPAASRATQGSSCWNGCKSSTLPAPRSSTRSARDDRGLFSPSPPLRQRVIPPLPLALAPHSRHT